MVQHPAQHITGHFGNDHSSQSHDQGCRVLVFFCVTSTPTPGLENLEVQTPTPTLKNMDSDSKPKIRLQLRL